jgi:hypothetical protein
MGIFLLVQEPTTNGRIRQQIHLACRKMRGNVYGAFTTLQSKPAPLFRDNRAH